MKNLTKKQEQCLNILKTFYKNNGYWPTFREIANAMGLKSSAGASQHIKALKAKGYVSKATHHARSIRLIEPITHATDLVKAHYWLIHFQENYKVMHESFNREGFEKYARENFIHQYAPSNEENIKTIKKAVE